MIRRSSQAYSAILAVVVVVVVADETPLTHDWKLVHGRHWQIVSPLSEAPATTDDREGTRGSCPAGMVDVRGEMKLDGALSVEERQNAACVAWIEGSDPPRCARFDAARWRETARELRTRPVRFCIDRYEYPNRLGEYPLVVVTWQEARHLCAMDGKRLCTEDEWTFACEGEEALPYPYGYERDSDACVIDRRWREVDERALAVRDGRAARREIDRLWQGAASGASARCRSPLGVYDMTGNVDEWTESVQPSGLPSILKGGYWGPIRARCRPSTRAHGGEYASYQQGFRCCAGSGPDAEP